MLSGPSPYFPLVRERSLFEFLGEQAKKHKMMIKK
jgi:hypothetical protein